MSKYFAIVLLLGLLLSTGGSGLWLQVERYQVRRLVKHRILAGIDRAELVYFHLPPTAEAALHWEHAGEFRYQGNWYDVVHRRQRGDTLHLWCWPDAAETRLDRQIGLAVAWLLGQDPQQQQRHTRLLRWWQQVYLVPDVEASVPAPARHGYALLAGGVVARLAWPPPVPPPRRG